jgi:hypothetical protein
MNYKLILIGIVALALVAGGWFLHKGVAKPQVVNTQTVVHDTTYVTKTLKGKTLVIHKADTVTILQDNSETLASYEAIIEQLSNQTGQDGNGQIGQPTPLPASNSAHLRAGLGLDATISKQPAFTPKVSLMLLNHLTACYGYNLNDNKHVAGISWLF